MTCCGNSDVNGLDRLFRGAPVRRERRAFERQGLNRRQQGFFEGLEPVGQTVLDLGCGVGALGLTALSRGAAGATFADVSRAYLNAARALAEASGVRERSSFLQGDALRLELPEADLVMLDRVVCCYPEGPALLRKAAGLSRSALLFSYPRPTPYLRLGQGLLNAGFRLFRHPYRFYLHDEGQLSQAAESSGHRLVAERRYGPWRLCVYRKEAGEQGRFKDENPKPETEVNAQDFRP